MPLLKVLATEGNARELNAGQPDTNVSDHRVLNNGVSQITSVVRREQHHPRPTWSGYIFTPFSNASSGLLMLDDIFGKASQLLVQAHGYSRHARIFSAALRSVRFPYRSRKGRHT